MKKLIVIAIIALMPALCHAQARITNTTGKSVTIKSSDKSSEQMIAPHKKASVSFLPESGTAQFYLYYFEGMNEKSAGLIEKKIEKGEADIVAGDFTGASKPSAKVGQGEVSPVKVATEGSSKRQTTTLILVDSSDYRVVALDNVFAGVALAPGQATTDYFTIETGQVEITFKHDVVKENEDLPHGRKYRQSVWSGIIVQGQTMLVLKNENLTEMKGDPITTFAKSLIPYKISFTAGPWKGQALRCGDFTKKKELSEGFNSMSIQFVGPDGLKYQADIEFICTKKDKPLIFRETDIKNKKVIKQ